MGGVGAHGQPDVLVSHTVQTLDVCSQVILYVTGALYREVLRLEARGQQQVPTS